VSEQVEPGGVYVHVPFCRHACRYCDFHFSTQLRGIPDVVSAMLREAELRLPQGLPAATLYWGGGTPSVLPEADFVRLNQALRAALALAQGAECTLEVNPEDVSASSLALWKEQGFNRLSVGVQSFRDERLDWMGRPHRGQDAEDAVRRAQDAGFSNLSLDLIYGLPGSSLGEWQEQVGRALDLGTPHLSAYALTVEPRTALFHDVAKGKAAAPSDDRAAEDFMWLRAELHRQDWDAYEVSNYAKPGFRAQHNSAYWKGRPYVGIGPGAHSFDGLRTRRANLRSNPGYQKALAAATPSKWFEVEVLSDQEWFHEQVLTQLRRQEGLSRAAAHGRDLDRAWASWIRQGMLRSDEQGWRLDGEGWLWADAVAADAFGLEP
jgi:oxygen-independent coproporphyrinogen-3 oxidase